MEPWDGPASITFCDGRVLGAKLDRNGLRPGRWAQTDDGWVVLASETGALPLEPARIVRRGRLKPGALWIVDLRARRAVRRPRGRVRDRVAAAVRDVGGRGDDPARGRRARRAAARARGAARAAADRVRLHPRGPRHPDRPDGRDGQGADRLDGRRRARCPRCRDRAPPLFSYFKQRFAQVTNPAIDSLREDLVMSLTTWLGRGPALLDDAPPPAAGCGWPRPVLTAEDLARVVASPLPWAPLDATWPMSLGVAGLEAAVERLVGEARERGRGRRRHPRASATAASVRAARRSRRCWPWPRSTTSSCARGLRTRCSLVVDSGEPREVHHVACLVGYGADAVHPWLAGDEIVPALGKGLLKVMSKMGVSTVSAYRGAQVFEAIGLGPELIERHFVGTPSKLGGLGLRGLAREVLDAPRAHVPARRRALPLAARRRAPQLEPGHRRRAAARRVAALRRGRRRGLPPRRAARAARRSASATRSPLEDVEPATEIMKRFATGAMSLGSISPEAHESLALAMNEIGGRSNTGEGGEDPARFADDRRSRDQAGRVRALRRDDRVPGQRRRAADQGRAGRQARRGRPAARATRSTRTSAGCATRRPAWS